MPHPLASSKSLPTTDVFQPKLPGSKSLTNRALALASARCGRTIISGALHADDTTLFADCLDRFDGLTVTKDGGDFDIERAPGNLRAPAGDEPLYIGAAGTPARFLMFIAADAEGTATITGTARLCERPMSSGIDALVRLGREVEQIGASGCLPVRITGGRPNSTRWRVDGSVSSQFASGLLLSAARQDPSAGPISVEVSGNLVSRPYTDMTTSMMRSLGIDVRVIGTQTWSVLPGEVRQARISVEPDASSMSYFLGAAAILGGATAIDGLGKRSPQGDVAFATVLAEMGCQVDLGNSSIELTGPSTKLKGIDIDLETMPDMVLTLAVVAAFAEGTTRIRNIGNLRLKECDRLHAASEELQRMGIQTREGDDWLEIRPDASSLKPALIQTYDDHRVAMAFSLAALRHPGVRIENPACVSKSFPGYWAEYARLRQAYGLAN